MAELTDKQINNCVREAQIAFCLDNYPSFEVALARKVEAALSATGAEDAKDAEIARLLAIINTPQADEFLRAVSTEAEHQRQRWGSEHDAGKTPADWFWLVGYLAGKALHSHAAGNLEKAEHHVITTAAACANWHRAMFGKTDMRPGHENGARFDDAARTQPNGAAGGGEVSHG